MNAETRLSRADIEHLPNYRRKTRSGEYSSACPFCGVGEDRFLFWPAKGNYLCRRCEAKGFVVEADSLTFTAEQYQAWKEAETERQRLEQQKTKSILEQIAASPNAERYHQQMTDRSYWYSQGLLDTTINRYQLGYTSICPTAPGSASYTIPVMFRGRLYNIRHRLVLPDKGGKYRPEMAGLPAALFNADVLDTPDWMTVLVEGEVKAMVLSQYGYQAVGVPGASTFKDKWLKLFENCGIVFVAFDPGADEQAQQVGEILASITRVKVCSLPTKPDDMFVKYRASSSEFFKFLMLGQSI